MASGSIFGTDGVRGTVGGTRMNAAFALHLGYSAGRVLTRAGSQAAGARARVLIGRDTRVSADMLEGALQAGLTAAGVDVILGGTLPTPAVAYLVRAQRLQAGVVISASHNPFPDNGIKFFSARGTKLPDAVQDEIDAGMRVPPGCVASHQLGRVQRLDDASGRYIEFCKSTVPTRTDFLGMHIVIDAGHGAAHQTAPEVLRELGARVTAICCEPDGFNINQRAGVMHPQALVDAVRGHGADIGIALDGDADRVLMVDSTGRVFNGDELLYAIVRDRAQRGPVPGVVGTQLSNLALERQLNQDGIAFDRAAVGDRFVLERLHERGWQFGGETSGHLLCLDRHTTGDGTVAALQVLAALQRAGQTLSDWVGALHLYPQCHLDVPLSSSQGWQTHVGFAQACSDIERRLGSQGRYLVRPSGTEPKLRLMVEADDGDLALACAQRLAQALVTASLN